MVDGKEEDKKEGEEIQQLRELYLWEQSMEKQNQLQQKRDIMQSHLVGYINKHCKQLSVHLIISLYKYYNAHDALTGAPLQQRYHKSNRCAKTGDGRGAKEMFCGRKTKDNAVKEKQRGRVV